MIPPSAILETCLGVQALARAKEFYANLFGYPVMRSDERFCAFDIGGQQVLLLFVRGSDPAGTVLSFGVIPPRQAISMPWRSLGPPRPALRPTT
jgi:extradiol dioxygenase family protein